MLLGIHRLFPSIATANSRSKVDLGANSISAIAYAHELVLFGESADELQTSVNDSNRACEEFGMTISSSKTQMMHIGKPLERLNVN